MGAARRRHTCRTAPTVLLRVEDMLRTSLSAGRRRATLVREVGPSLDAELAILLARAGGGCAGRSHEWEPLDLTSERAQNARKHSGGWVRRVTAAGGCARAAEDTSIAMHG